MFMWGNKSWGLCVGWHSHWDRWDFLQIGRVRGTPSFCPNMVSFGPFTAPRGVIFNMLKSV